MAMGSVLLGLAMVAAEGPSCPPIETTTYQVRVLTLDGLDWRTSSYSRLQPVSRQGTSMVWTADRALASSLASRAKATSPNNIIMAVGEAAMNQGEAVNYIAAMNRVADGPMNQSSAIAFLPVTEQVEERFAIKVEGRKLDQGILTRISLEETHVDIIHSVTQVETLKPIPSKTERNLAGAVEAVANWGGRKIASQVQIPEVSRAKVEGEWLIPNDGVLLVSLGVKTAADDKGMAVVRERVAVIEAFAGGIPRDALIGKVSLNTTTPFEHAKLGQPVLPGRSLPEAIDPAGALVDLPPLPEALASADLDRIKPEPSQPSPQAPHIPVVPADAAVSRTAYDAAPPAPIAGAFAPPPPAPIVKQGAVSGAAAGMALLGQAIEALEKAGQTISFDIYPKELASLKADSEAECQADSQVKDGPKAPGRCEAPTFDLQAPDANMLLAMLKAGVNLDTPMTVEGDNVVIFQRDLAKVKAKATCEDCQIGVKLMEALKAKANCEKCLEDATVCPANASSMKPGQGAGGMKLAEEEGPRIAFIVKGAKEARRLETRFVPVEDAAELVGKAETVVIPLNGQYSIEVKVSVVPNPCEKAKDPISSTARKAESSTTQR